MNGRRRQRVIMRVAIAWVGLIWLWVFSTVIGAMQGCATMRHVVRTIDDVATVACELFGTEHPTEFAYYVRKVAPAQAPITRHDLSVKDLCAIHAVLEPFIQDQLRLQHETTRNIRAGMGGPDANHPK